MAREQIKRFSREERPGRQAPDGEHIEIVKIFLDIRDGSGYPPRFISGGPAPRG
jgi:hypothetical protein